LGSLADSLEEQTVIPGHDIPGYPSAGVEGHKGDLVIGRFGGVDAAFVRGRFHAYEGHPVEILTLPVRILAALGVSHLIVSNAAGSLHPEMPEGSVMRITDHINLTGINPMPPVGPDTHHRVAASCFDAAWGRKADDIALGAGVPLRRGVYLWLLGPSYETPAEIRFFRSIGADAVGMSTVPEAIVANRLGLKVLGFSAITNLAAGLGHEHLNHDDVLAVGAALNGTMFRLLRGLAASVVDEGAA
jgi:purine-nucleoside phosphorylase